MPCRQGNSLVYVCHNGLEKKGMTRVFIKLRFQRNLNERLS